MHCNSEFAADDSNVATIDEGDGNLVRRVTKLLRNSGYGPLARVQCRVDDGVVELFGQVPTFFLKQMAQCLILRNEAVKQIRNEILVA